MSEAENNHAKGLLLTAIGGLALTADIPLIRLASGDQWSIMMARSGLTLAAGLIIWIVWKLASRKAPALVPGRPGLAVAALYGLATICFIGAVYHTSTANLVFILALNSMFAALLSRIFLKEKLRPATFLAMLAMLAGVLIIVGDSIGTGNLFGDLLALASAVLIAGAITISRASGRDMGFAALLAVALPLVVAAAMTAKTGFRIDHPWWIVLNGALVMPLSFYCLATGPRYISGPEVAMFYLLETVLAPVWVWLLFAEAPTRQSLVGGAILILALVAHSLWQLYSGRRRRAASVLRHPA
ncbi:DMT family transporter [Chelativorans sp.]|uniref:DMT family transporter n=1 Tax=Chelativorans sp. TaxID=2203393 RepID=UPI0028126E9B|nr:DMT family transporter [Chelativorans sp.]